MIKFKASEVVLGGRSLITNGVEVVSRVASISVDGEAGISDKASELAAIDGNSVASTTSLVGRGPRSTVELSVDMIAEEMSWMTKVVYDDSIGSATWLVGRGFRSLVQMSAYPVAEESS